MNKKKQELVTVGTCPICNKGTLIEGTNGYMCNHFKSIDDNCTFTIYKSYFGKSTNEKMIDALLKNGKTEIFDDFKTKEGKTFSAFLVIENGIIVPNFNFSKKMDFICPSCGGYVYEFVRGYACENYTKKQKEDSSRECQLFIPKTICQHKLTQKELINLIEQKKTDFIYDFLNKKNDNFIAKLEMDEELNIVFSNTICNCPKCESGDIYISNKAFRCSNYRKENIRCEFVVWREISGREISIKEAQQLCKDRVTNKLKFKTRDGKEYEKKLSLNEEFRLKLI